MNIQLLISDLDGTLLRSDSTLSEYTRSVLEKAARRGIKIAVATGRAYAAMPACVSDFPCFDYAVTSNGAAVYEMHTHTLLRHHVLAQRSAEALIAYALEHHLGLELICGGKAYGERYYFEHPKHFHFNQRSWDYLNATRTKIENLDDFLKENITALESIDFVLPSCDAREDIEKIFCKDTSLYITSSYPTIIEFSAKGCGKANALRFLMEQEHIAPAQVIAFGNADNDVEMMRLARYGVATANAPAEVRAQCASTCESCDDDGVAQFLESILF